LFGTWKILLDIAKEVSVDDELLARERHDDDERAPCHIMCQVDAVKNAVGLMILIKTVLRS